MSRGVWGYPSGTPGNLRVSKVREKKESFSPGLREAMIAGTGRTIYLHQDAVVAKQRCRSRRVAPGEFKDAGAAKMQRATEGHIDKPLVFGSIVRKRASKGSVRERFLRRRRGIFPF
jgi:hypothetical protein